MFVSLESPTGTTISADVIFGDATVIDFDQGVAYSFEAIPFAAGPLNNGNRVYTFNGSEYGQFPARLATNFIAPTQSPFDGLDEITAELVLFTLDGTLGSVPGPRVLLSINFYNDDAKGYSASYSFNCFTTVHLNDIDPRFLASALDSATGHLVLTPQITTHGDIAHDVLFGNGNGVRRDPVHGWLVQTTRADSQIGSGSWLLAADAAWGRAFARSVSHLMPEGTDAPILNALCDTAPCP